ncbi:protein BIC1-like [Olea europaea var. sylvestris]|uniref:Protein BIC1 n=1 Tax=Olea europaea subsp. europaea TaxID=158383 RepID=A0A8S0U021_OLEEU|nr:protein BIC1-like [Olea europaea var. sylvestris]CAA3011281.1 Hypothetical predicted protein [Olea europaea subsp. europaea]
MCVFSAFMQKESMKMGTPQNSNESEPEIIIPPFPSESKEVHSPEKPFSIEEKKSKSEEENQFNETETPPQDSSLSMQMKLKDTYTEPVVEDSGRERLKRHRVEVAGSVRIPDIWGQEDLLKDWTDCTAFDASLMNNNIMPARASLVEEGRRTIPAD